MKEVYVLGGQLNKKKGIGQQTGNSQRKQSDSNWLLKEISEFKNIF